jgi:hypothetical protein
MNAWFTAGLQTTCGLFMANVARGGGASVLNADAVTLAFLLLCGAWAIGSIVCSARLAAGLLAARRIRLGARRAHPTRDRDLIAAGEYAARAVGLARAPALGRSRAVSMPISLGFTRRAIVLPEWPELLKDRARLRAGPGFDRGGRVCGAATGVRACARRDGRGIRQAGEDSELNAGVAFTPPERQRCVHVEMQILKPASKDVPRQLTATSLRVQADGSYYASVTDDEAARITKALAPVHCPRLTCFDGQRGSVFIRSETPCVPEYRVSLRDGRVVGDPVAQTCRTGLQCAVRPVVSGDATAVTVEFEITSSELERMHEAKTAYGPVQSPAIRRGAALRATITQRVGEWALLVGPKRAAPRLAVLLRCVPITFEEVAEEL